MVFGYYVCSFPIIVEALQFYHRPSAGSKLIPFSCDSARRDVIYEIVPGSNSFSFCSKKTTSCRALLAIFLFFFSPPTLRRITIISELLFLYLFDVSN